MANDLPVQYFSGRDGVQLAFREMGEGRPLVLIHGFFSTATVNWVRYGHAAKIAALGYRVVMPDLRGHGDSAKPHDPAAYPPDVLADDGFALVEALGLTGYALGGYSLGGRAAGRTAHFRRILENQGGWDRRSPEGKAEAFMKSTGADPVAGLCLLGSNVDTPAEALAAIQAPVLVLAGDQDDDNGSTEELARVLPHGQAVRVPGNHMSAVAQPDLGRAIADY